MSLFQWALALNQREKNICHVENLKISAVECFENGNYHEDRKLFHAKQHFLKWIPAPENCKNQEINRIKSKKTIEGF